jgi:hypothetical protein
MLHLVVLCPRYIKIKYVPQQRYYDTSFKVWSDPITTMPVKRAAFSHTLSLTMKINTMSFSTYRIFYLSYVVYNGRIR